MYDVLCLDSKPQSVNGSGAKIMLNRSGTIQIRGRADRQPPVTEPIGWARYLEAQDSTEFIEWIASEAGLRALTGRPLSGPALVYTAIAALASLGAMAEPFRIEPGFYDSSGFSGSGIADWWDEMCVLAPELTEPRSSDVCGQPGHRFWRVERSDFEITFETSTATAWIHVEEDLDDLVNEDPTEIAARYEFDLVRQAHLNGAQPHRLGQPSDPTLRVLQAVLELGQC